MNTCLPCCTAYSKCIGRKPGGVARMTRSGRSRWPSCRRRSPRRRGRPASTLSANWFLRFCSAPLALSSKASATATSFTGPFVCSAFCSARTASAAADERDLDGVAGLGEHAGGRQYAAGDGGAGRARMPQEVPACGRRAGGSTTRVGLVAHCAVLLPVCRHPGSLISGESGRGRRVTGRLFVPRRRKLLKPFGAVLSNGQVGRLFHRRGLLAVAGALDDLADLPVAAENLFR